MAIISVSGLSRESDCGIVASGIALRRNWIWSKPGGGFARRWLVAALVVGVLLGTASWPLTYWMGYPIRVEAEAGRIAGFPFFVAYFDSEGRDYVGPLTMPGAVANSLFWFLVPQFVLFLLSRRANHESRNQA